MENKKGEIATLLTLSLLVVGTVTTLLTSYFTNKQKIATNLKAAASFNCSGIIQYGLYNCTPSQICGDYSNYVPNSQVIEGSIRKVCCKKRRSANPSACIYSGISGPIPTITPNRNASQCSSGAYTTLTDCEVVCGINNCRSCKINTTIKYECKVSINSDLKPCVKLRTYATEITCLSEHPDGKCNQCLFDSSVRYEFEGSGPTQAPYRSTATPTPTSVSTPAPTGGGGTSTLTPRPGQLGGRCMYGHICYSDLVCDRGTGICQKPTPTSRGGRPLLNQTQRPTSTPTSTLSLLPNSNEVIDNKGAISFFIPFDGNNYYSDYEKFHQGFFDGFSFSLKRKTDCSFLEKLINDCSYSKSIAKDENGMKIIFHNNNTDRSYLSEDPSLEPNNLDFYADYLGREYRKNNFRLESYDQQSLPFDYLPPINLAEFYRKVSLKFSKQAGYFYEKGESIEMSINPIPRNYSGTKKVSFDSNIDIIYIDDSKQLPSSITIQVTYLCGNNQQSLHITNEITIPENSNKLDSTENDVGEIMLKCSQ